MRIWHRGTFDRGIKRTLKNSREIFPDSLIFFFPSIQNREPGITLLSVNETLFSQFPVVKKTDLQPLPWKYCEMYVVKDVTRYQARIKELRKMSKSEVEDYGTLIGIPEVDTLFVDGKTLVMTHQSESQLADDDFRIRYSGGSPKEGNHGYSSGVTYSDKEQRVYYWVLAW